MNFIYSILHRTNFDMNFNTNSKRTITPENFVTHRTRSNSVMIQPINNPLLNAPKKNKMSDEEWTKITQNKDESVTPTKNIK